MFTRRAPSMVAYATALHAPNSLTGRQGVALSALVCSPNAVRYFSQTKALLAKPDQEELDELAREAKLRNRFAEKKAGEGGMFGNMFGGGGSAANTNTTTSNSSGGSNTTSDPGEVIGKFGPFKFTKRKAPPGGARRQLTTWEFLVWFSALYTLVIYYMSWDPRRRSWLGIEWWAQPIDTTACWVLLKLILPSSQQGPIRSQYFNMSKGNSTMTFSQFISQYHPHAMSGYQYSQQEIISAMIAVLANEENLNFCQTLYGKTVWSSDPKKNADTIMDALKLNHAHIFSSGSGPGGMMMMGGGGGGGIGGGAGMMMPQQQMMMGQAPQMMGQAPQMMMVPAGGGVGGSTPSWGGVQAQSEDQAPAMTQHDFSGGKA